MIDLLIAPLHTLADALGTGILPSGNPADHTREISRALDALREGSTVAARTAMDGWQGAGADGMADAGYAVNRATAELSDVGPQISALVESASTEVRAAAQEIDGLIESFRAAVLAMGPAAFTVAGVTALIPVAIDHVSRGSAIVGRTQGALADDSERLLALARMDAPAEALLRDGPGGVDGKGVAITLPDGSTAIAPNERAATAVRAALSQQGVPYVWGGTTPAGFDCSGFTQWAYRQAGVELPRLAQDQDTAGFAVSRSNLMPGDLAVWSGHVAMYIGNNQYVEAGDPVQVSPLRTTNLDHTFEGFYRPR